MLAVHFMVGAISTLVHDHTLEKYYKVSECACSKACEPYGLGSGSINIFVLATTNKA